MAVLDLKDRKILYALELNARISDSELAQTVRLKREVVAYRLKRLQSEGIILKYHAIVNSMNLGKLMYRTYFRVQNLNAEQEKILIVYLQKEMNWVTRVRGSWDIATMVFVKSPYEFDFLLKRFLAQFGTNVQNYWVAVMTRLHQCKRSYLLEGQKETVDLVLEKDTENDGVDQLDLDIINYLGDNGRAKFQEIGTALSVNEKLVRDRIKLLVKKRIILGFTTFLSIPKLNMLYYKVHFDLHDKSQVNVQSIINAGLVHPNVIYIDEGIGCGDVELELHVANTNELYKVMDFFRTKFKDIIRNSDFMEYTEEYQLNYNPLGKK